MVGCIGVGTDAGSTPPIAEVISDEGLDPMGGYISQRHISAAQYISTRPIFDLAVGEERWTRSLETIISW